MAEVPQEPSRSCVECDGLMSPIVIMDKVTTVLQQRHSQRLEYRLPEDRVSFWTSKYPTAGPVRAYLCAGCGRIALYGAEPEA
jgi:hypothetical protein